MVGEDDSQRTRGRESGRNDRNQVDLPESFNCYYSVVSVPVRLATRIPKVCRRKRAFLNFVV